MSTFAIFKWCLTSTSLLIEYQRHFLPKFEHEFLIVEKTPFARVKGLMLNPSMCFGTYPKFLLHQPFSSSIWHLSKLDFVCFFTYIKLQLYFNWIVEHLLNSTFTTFLNTKKGYGRIIYLFMTINRTTFFNLYLDRKKHFGRERLLKSQELSYPLWYVRVKNKTFHKI